MPAVPPQQLKQSSKQIKENTVVNNQSLQAVELVKNHPTLLDPVSGKMRSVEKRMIDARQTFSPNMTWNYEARLIGKGRYRVTQYADNGRGELHVRIWIVDLSTNEVKPENDAAKKLYY